MLNVGAISEGYVLDHIQAGTSLALYRDLHLDETDYSVAIIRNARSSKMGAKDILKVQCDPNTLDLDVLDPSVFPGTGTPEPGGLSFDQLRQAVTQVCQKAQIVACDVNELAPHYDPSGVSTAVACKIVREMLLAI